MQKLKFFQYLSVGLLLLNIGLITFFFITKPDARPPFLQNAIKVLNLDEEQEKAFRSMAQKHGDAMQKLNEQHGLLLRNYFKNAAESPSALNELLVLEQKKLEITNAHFKEVQSILNPNQEENFNDFVQTILGNIMNSNKNPPRKKPGGPKPKGPKN